MTNLPTPRAGREPVELLSTRLSLEVYAMLKSITDTGVTQRAAVEHAIRAAYGPTEEDEAEDLRFKIAQEVYIKAVERLLAQVEGPDESKDLIAAFEDCAKAHKALLVAWPMEEVSDGKS